MIMKLKNLLGKLGLSSTVIGCVLAIAPSANGMEFTFSQGGFRNVGAGTILSGSFSGDAGVDGILSLDELDEFEASFGIFAWNLNSLNQFEFDIENNNLLFERAIPSFPTISLGLEGAGGRTTKIRNSFVRSFISDAEVVIMPVVDDGGGVAVVPTPVTILPSLFGICLSAVRKRKVALSEDS